MTNPKLQLPFIVSLTAMVLVMSFFILKPFLATLALATVCAVILTPLYKKILIRVNGKETLATSITMVISVICIVIPLIFLGTKVFQEAVGLYGSLSQEETRQHIITVALQNTGQTFEKYLPGTEVRLREISDNLDTYIKGGLAWIISNLGLALSGVSTFILDLLIFFISLYYLIRDGGRFKRAIWKISPLDEKDDEIVFARLESAINSVIVGNLFIALVQGIITAIGFAIFGVPNSLLWGMLAVFASLVPRIGTAVIIFPAVFYLLAVGDSFMALGLTLWGIFVVGMIDNILGPKLIGKRLQIHPLFILLSALGGLIFFGPVGIFLGPLTISLLFALVSVYDDLRQRAKERLQM